MGTGPFVLEEYREKQRFVFKRHPQYFEAGKPYLDGVEVYTIPDASAQLAALRSGRIDLIPAGTGQGLAHQMAPEARSIPGAKVLTQRVFQTSENLIGRLDQKPWSDVRVRRAAALSVDREGFHEGDLPGRRGPALGRRASRRSTSFRSTSSASRRATTSRTSPPPRAPRRGRFSNGFKARLNTTPGYGPDYLSRTELLKDMLGKIGIDTSIVVHEYPVWISSVYKGTTRASRISPRGRSATRTSGSAPISPATLGTYPSGGRQDPELVKGARQAGTRRHGPHRSASSSAHSTISSTGSICPSRCCSPSCTRA